MAEATYEVRYDDTDPVINYSPYGDGSATGGWVTVFAAGTRPAVDGSTYGVGEYGDSTHVTQLPGATFSFMFWGTSIKLFGDAAGSSYTITLDNEVLPTPMPQGSTLASLTGLLPGEHVLVLQVTSVKSRFTFDQAIFNVGTGSAGTLISNQTHHSLDGSWKYDSGAWHPVGPLTPLPHDNMVVLRTSNPGSPAEVIVSGNAVFLYGNAFPGGGTYEVHLGAQGWLFNASSHNFIQDALIFCYAEMDPTKDVALYIINKFGGSYVDIDYVHVLQFNGGSPPSSSPPASSFRSGGTAEFSASHSLAGAQTARFTGASSTTSTALASVSASNSSDGSQSGTATQTAPNLGPAASGGSGISGGHQTLIPDAPGGKHGRASSGLVAGVAVAGGVALLFLFVLIAFVTRRRTGRPHQSSDNILSPSERPSSSVEPWVVLLGTIPGERDLRVRKFLPFSSQTGAVAPSSNGGTSDSGSAAPLAPIDMERVLQFVATRIDTRAQATGISEAQTAPPRYI